MGEVASHPAWAERRAFHDLHLDGEWSVGEPGLSGLGVWVLDSAGEKVAACKLEDAPGIVAALNTNEGRRAFVLSRTENR